MTREEAIAILQTMEYGLSNQVASAYCLKKYGAVRIAIKALEQEPILEKDGTLVVTTEHYENVGRVLVQHGTSGTLFYQDQEPCEDVDIALDKIKAEIKDNTCFINETTEKEGIDFDTVEKIIDKYKAEREVRNE